MGESDTRVVRTGALAPVEDDVSEGHFGARYPACTGATMLV